MCTQDIDQAIIRDLTVHGTCQVEDILRRLTGFTWNQVFSALDRMSRDGRLALQRLARCEYEVSIIPGRRHRLEAEVSR